MILTCIDPGTTESGVVVVDDDLSILEAIPDFPNDELCLALRNTLSDHMAIEMIASYGMPVGKETFETCLWIGRFIESFSRATKGENHTLVYRKDVKLCLCGSLRAKDANIRQALLDRYASTGGGKTPQVGTKKYPGPLYRIKSHAWPALAVAHTWLAQQQGMI